MSLFQHKFILLLAFIAGSMASFAQTSSSTSDNNTPKDNSPYSRIGLGDFVNPNFAAASGFGGLGATFNDAYHTNTVNPASLGFLRSTSFEVGLFAQYSSLKSPNSDPLDVWSGNINYISLGFPMRNPINEVLDRKKRDIHWGMNIALLPYTTVGYNVTTESTVPQDGATVLTNFIGRGGTYKVQWGNAVKYKDLSVGVNLGYAFGKIINERDVFLVDTLSGYNNELIDEISIGGLVWNAGVMYKHKFKKPNEKGEMEASGKSITVGVYGNSKHTINTNSSQFYRRFGRQTGKLDTLSNIEDLKGNATLPTSFGVGILYEDLDKWRVGLDYSMSQWSEYTNDAKNDQLEDSYRLAFGGEYIPNANSYNSYLQKMRYRIGGFYEKDPRNINEQLTSYGITFGLGFPVILPRQQKSFFNLALEFGQFGAKNALEETYIKATVGFTLNDNSWFFKRKFE